MLQTIKHRLLTRKIAGVQLNFTGDGFEMRAIVCRRKGSEFFIVSQHSNLSSFDELKNIISQDTAVACVITGKGVIHHELEGRFEDWSSSIQERLPGAKINLFAGQIDQGKKIAAIARLDFLEKIITDFYHHEIFPLSFDLGVLSSESLIQLLDDEYINLPPYVIMHNEGSILGLSSAKSIQNHYKIAGKEVATNLLLSLGAALNQILNFPRLTYQLDDLEGESSTNFNYNQYANWLGIGGLGVLFTVLLMNFLFFGSLSKNLTQVESELYFAQTLISQIDSLSKELEEKELAIEKTGSNRNSRISFYADEIGSSLLGGIKLTQLNIFPTIRTSQLANDFDTYNVGQIQIKGENKSSQQLNTWIDELELFEWVADVRLQPYKSTSKIGEFEVIVKIRV